jgi:hypothetical protein
MATIEALKRNQFVVCLDWDQEGTEKLFVHFHGRRFTASLELLAVQVSI